MGSKRPAGQRRLTEAEAIAELDRQCRARGITCGDPDCTWPEHRVPGDSSVIRGTDGSILRGPSLPCGCPLDAGCDGHHPGRLA